MRKSSSTTRRKVHPLFAAVAVFMAALLAFMAFDARVLAPAFANEEVPVVEDTQDTGGDPSDDSADVPAEPSEDSELFEAVEQPEDPEELIRDVESSDTRAGPDGAPSEEMTEENVDEDAAEQDASELLQVEYVSSVVTFYSDEATSSPAILERRQVTAEAGQAAVVDVSDVVAAPPTSAQRFIGWQFAGEVHADEIYVDPRDGDVNLYPAFDSGHWLRFDVQESDAVYVASRFVAAEEGELVQLDVTSRAGYAFDGWFYGVEDNGEAVLGEQATDSAGVVLDPGKLRAALMSDDVLLYAKWTGERTTYRVAIWHQNPDDDGYSFEGYDTVGDEPHEVVISGGMTDYAATSTVPGFFAKAVEQKRIAGDGSTVLTLEYDRETYEVKFHQTRDKNSALFEGLTISARYGADIHDRWPKPAAGETRYTAAWYTLPGESSDVFVTGIGTMPLGGAHYYAKTDKGKNFATVFMTQSLDDLSVFELYESQEFTTSQSPWTTADDYKPIKGFAVNAATAENAEAIRAIAAGDKGAVYDPTYTTSDAVGTRFEDKQPTEGPNGVNRYAVNFYYLRLQYDIVFEERGGKPVADATDIYYEASLAQSEPSDYVIGETSYTSANGLTYRFAGWYSNDSLAGEPFDFERATMPAANLVLYAKWVPADYLVQVNPDGGEFTSDQQSTHFRVEHGKTLSPIGVERHYVADPNGAYVYDYETASDDADDFGRAVYVQAEDGEPGQRYRYSENAYSLYGWYHADETARAPGDPFDFSEPIVSDTSIIARWRAAGVYDIAYNAVVTQDGDKVSGQIGWMLDEGYADLSPTFIMHTPENITSESGDDYEFVGWRVVESFAQDAAVLDPTLYVEGDGFVVDSELARDNTIHIQAVYELQEEPAEPVEPVEPTVPADPGADSGSGDASAPTSATTSSAGATTASMPQTGDRLLELVPGLVVGIALAALALALAGRALRRRNDSIPTE